MTAQLQQKSITGEHRKKALITLRGKWQLLMMFAIPLVWYLLFCYVPMYGIQIAFKDYVGNLGYVGSPFVGLKHFNRFFSSYYCWEVIWNTFSISIYSLAVNFPAPILLALLINELSGVRYKKFLQNATYIPHFLSVVVVAGMTVMFTSAQYGIINTLLGFFGIGPIAFMEEAKWFKTVYVFSGMWQQCGWDSIIYIAALAGVDPTLYEAARMDGASRLQRIVHISLPSISPTIVTLLILQIGQIMNVGFEKALLLQNSLNLSSSEIISTFIYKNGIQLGDFSYTTAVGLINSLLNLVLIVLANTASRKLFETSLW